MASRALGILRRLDGVLKKFGPGDRTVYKRVITAGTGDALIGRATSTPTDTLITPQPLYTRLARYDVGPGSRSEMFAQGTKQLPSNNFSFLCSPNGVAKADVASKAFYFVLADASNNKEVFEILDYDEVAMGGVDVALIVYAKSVGGP